MCKIYCSFIQQPTLDFIGKCLCGLSLQQLSGPPDFVATAGDPLIQRINQLVQKKTSSVFQEALRQPSKGETWEILFLDKPLCRMLCVSTMGAGRRPHSVWAPEGISHGLCTSSITDSLVPLLKKLCKPLSIYINPKNFGVQFIFRTDSLVTFFTIII